MDGGILIELALKKLIESGDANSIHGMATAFQLAIGNDNCIKLAEVLKECLGEDE